MDLPTWKPPHYAVNPCGCETFVDDDSGTQSGKSSKSGKKVPRGLENPSIPGSLEYLNIGLELESGAANLEQNGINEIDKEMEEIRQMKLEEDSRFDYLYRMQETMTEVFDNVAYIHPHGMTDYDYKVIPCDKRKDLEDFKMKVRRENYIYLNNHPEIDALMALFIEKLLKTQPTEPIKFAAEFFTFRRITSDEINREIDDEKKKLHEYHNPRPDWKRMSFTSSHKKGYKDINEIKSLNLGPLARAFGDTPPPTPPRVVEPPKPIIKKGKYYCGCKDWKIGKGRKYIFPDLLKKTKISPPAPENSESDWMGEADENPIPAAIKSSTMQIIKHPPIAVASTVSGYQNLPDEEQAE